MVPITKTHAHVVDFMMLTHVHVVDYMRKNPIILCNFLCIVMWIYKTLDGTHMRSHISMILST